MTTDMEPVPAPFTPVRGRCPACGRGPLTAYLHNGLVCTAEGCPRPGALQDLLRDRRLEQHEGPHAVKFSTLGERSTTAEVFHELRMAAEARADAAEEKLRRVEDIVAELDLYLSRHTWAQLATTDKEFLADLVDAGSARIEPDDPRTANRWWRDDPAGGGL
jgi:hypothetical protein